MGEYFANGMVVDAILAFLFFELMVLILVRRQGLRCLPALPLIANSGAGAALLLALRAALRGLAWQQIALWLAVALAFHLWDLAQRWSTRRTF